MLASAIAVLDEGLDVGFERTRQTVVFLPGPILQGLMPALVLVLGLRVIRYAVNVRHSPVVLEPVGKTAGDMARAVVAQQPELMNNRRPSAARERMCRCSLTVRPEMAYRSSEFFRSWSSRCLSSAGVRFRSGLASDRRRMATVCFE